jgi:hypothetical protein
LQDKLVVFVVWRQFDIITLVHFPENIFDNLVRSCDEPSFYFDNVGLLA